MNEKMGMLIMRLVEKDQKMREVCHRRYIEKYWNSVTESNTQEFKKIIKTIGWPTVSKVGRAASHGSWLLVQHADHDAEFQEHCLGLMVAEPLDEVSEVDIAYLYDRICVNRGRPQFFGTQFTNNHHRAYGPWPIELFEFVNERRVQIGLQPLCDYKKSLEAKYA